MLPGSDVAAPFNGSFASGLTESSDSAASLAENDYFGFWNVFDDIETDGPMVSCHWLHSSLRFVITSLF